MESPSKWYSLPPFQGLPALLVSARFAATSYTLHVTDLANIWVEKLDRRGILLRSLQENTSIDLVDAEVESQWAVFLSKIRAAFDPASPDHHLTSLSIDAHPKSHGGPSLHPKSHDGLTLHITCQLPEPLEPLRWPVYLVKCPPASLAAELTLPLIQEQYVRARDAEDLIRKIKEKDVLLNKLIHKLNSMRIPLENIFNSLSAKHVTTRAAAEEKLSGLAPFNEDKWKSERNSELPQDAQALLRGVFGGSLGFSGATGDLGVSDTLNDWWTKLPPGLHVADKPVECTSSVKESQVSETTSGNGFADAQDFQVHASLPRASQSQSLAVRTSQKDDDATESDDSDISQSHASRSQKKTHSKIGKIGGSGKASQDRHASQTSGTVHANEDDTQSDSEDDFDKAAPLKSSKRPLGKLGTIGKSKQSSEPTPEPPVVKPTIERDDDATETASDSGSDAASPKRSSPVAKPAASRKATLGRIGGKRKVASSPQASRQSTPNAPNEDPAPPKKAGGSKIGTIGKKTSPVAKRMHSEAPSVPDEAETEEMKAERKRAELDRVLNRPAAAPAKKKRKF